MELRDLRLFLVVAAAGSFSRAATITSSTQSAVSKRIAALESELGAVLFQRTGRADFDDSVDVSHRLGLTTHFDDGRRPVRGEPS